MEQRTPERTIQSGGEADTRRWGEALGAIVLPGDVITLEGDLGAGKTTFTQGLARGMGVRGVVNSPTFTLIKEYDGARCPLYHLDVYRLSPQDAGELGLDDYFYGEGVTVIEWASRLGRLLPDTHLAVTLRVAGAVERAIEVRPVGARYEERIAQWLGKEPGA